MQRSIGDDYQSFSSRNLGNWSKQNIIKLTALVTSRLFRFDSLQIGCNEPVDALSAT
jgi:hypothetical protein